MNAYTSSETGRLFAEQPTARLTKELEQLDALLACYRKLAPQLAYYRAANDVADLKQQLEEAQSRGDTSAGLERRLTQELYDLAWAIHDCPADA